MNQEITETPIIGILEARCYILRSFHVRAPCELLLVGVTIEITFQNGRL